MYMRDLLLLIVIASIVALSILTTNSVMAVSTGKRGGASVIQEQVNSSNPILNKANHAYTLHSEVSLYMIRVCKNNNIPLNDGIYTMLEESNSIAEKISIINSLPVSQILPYDDRVHPTEKRSSDEEEYRTRKWIGYIRVHATKSKRCSNI